MSDTARIAKLLSPAAVIRKALYNARRIAKREYKEKPNWVMAMELWGVGSTYAREFCLIADVDPDAAGFKLHE